MSLDLNGVLWRLVLKIEHSGPLEKDCQRILGRIVSGLLCCVVGYSRRSLPSVTIFTSSDAAKACEWDVGPNRAWAALLDRWLLRNVLASPICVHGSGSLLHFKRASRSMLRQV